MSEHQPQTQTAIFVKTEEFGTSAGVSMPIDTANVAESITPILLLQGACETGANVGRF
jgi:hypothetical protein